jgi:hypothetical protein
MSMNQLETSKSRSARRASLPAAILALAALGPAGCDADESVTVDGGADGAPADAQDAAGLAAFSFFVTSLAALQRLSGSQSGFGGDLRFGKADGLSGADEICGRIAEQSMPGAGVKVWHAFLSVTRGPDGKPVHAIDRVGAGPWYDRRGRLVAMTRADLLESRPKGADQLIASDLPNEDGVPNHAPDTEQVDNHDTLTGSNAAGQLYSDDWSHTCHDWTSAVGADGKPRVGHSWTRAGGVGGPGMFPGGPGSGDGGLTFGGCPDGGPPFVIMPGGGSTMVCGDFGDGGPRTGRGGAGDGGPTFMGGPDSDGGGGMMAGPGGGESWISTLDEAGCAPGVSLVEMGPPDPRNPTVGSGGGYGGFYCLALTP